VVLLGGTYSTGTDPLLASDAIYIHPATGAGRPLIDSNSGFAVVLGHAGATLENVELHTSAGGIGLIVGAGARAQRVISIASAGGATGCFLAASAASPPLLNDSGCIATGSGGTALMGSAGVTPGNDAVAVLRHVTAVATGSSSTGVASTSSGSGGSVTVDASSVIASGTSTDASAVGGSGGSAAIADFSFSNYDSQLEGTHGTVTDPGADTNQTAPAMLANPAAGDVHQLAGSFTIDRGARDAAAGSVDIDGESRSQGAAPDIGADEFTVLRRGPKCFGQSATLLAPGGSGPVTATPGRDVIVGTPGPDLILAVGGDDLVCGGGGRDTDPCRFRRRQSRWGRRPRHDLRPGRQGLVAWWRRARPHQGRSRQGPLGGAGRQGPFGWRRRQRPLPKQVGQGPHRELLAARRGRLVLPAILARRWPRRS